MSEDGAEAAYMFRPDVNGGEHAYKTMREIDVAASVGSLAVSYDKFGKEQMGEDKYAKIFVAGYERDFVFVFSFAPLYDND